MDMIILPRIFTILRLRTLLARSFVTSATLIDSDPCITDELLDFSRILEIQHESVDLLKYLSYDQNFSPREKSNPEILIQLVQIYDRRYETRKFSHNARIALATRLLIQILERDRKISEKSTNSVI
jgi:hypothetical protein